MAFAEFKFRSKELCRYVPFDVILPNDTNLEAREGNCHYGREPKTLMLLGGYGAIHTGLAYPETFGKIAGLSSALIIHDVTGKKEDFEDSLGNYEYYHQIFGDLDLLEKSAFNPEIQIKTLKEKGTELPEIYLTCGINDPFLECNREFYEFLRQEEIEAVYLEKEGNHDWFFWDRCLEDAILWFLGGEL